MTAKQSSFGTVTCSVSKRHNGKFRPAAAAAAAAAAADRKSRTRVVSWLNFAFRENVCDIPEARECIEALRWYECYQIFRSNVKYV
jgi:hypothetical protein